MGWKGRFYDFCLARAIDVAVRPMRLVRSTSRAVPMAKRALTKGGVFPLLDHYYEPLFDVSRLDRHVGARDILAIDFAVEGQLKLLQSFDGADLLKGIPKKSEEKSAFHMENGFFEAGDAEIWFHIVRYLKPKRIIEIGCGQSTKMARLALESLSLADPNYRCEHVGIEPYEAPWLEGLGVTVLRQKVEEVDLSLFAGLEANDVLFIDSSHMIRPQGDVLREFLQIIPRLDRGVVVHVHDIFTPRDYPLEWLEMPRFWNEQYLLEAFLSYNAAWEVMLSLNLLKHDFFSDLQAVCPHLTHLSEPGSFYMRRR